MIKLSKYLYNRPLKSQRAIVHLVKQKYPISSENDKQKKRNLIIIIVLLALFLTTPKAILLAKSFT